MTGPRAAVRWSVNVERIERTRVLKGWTRKHLASVAQVDPKTLTDMCAGRRQPTFSTLQAVTTALRLPLAEVIVFSDESGENGTEE